MSETLFGDWNQINPALIREMMRVGKEHPIHMKCIDYIKRSIHSQPLSIYSAGEQMRVSPRMRELLNTFYMRCSENAMLWLITVGVLPLHLVRTTRGEIVPRMAEPNTIDLFVKYDIHAENIVMRAKRSGATKVAILSDNGASASCGTEIPSQYETQRMDLGTEIPAMDDFDDTIVVITGFGYDPTPDGRLQSIVWASYDYIIRDWSLDCLFENYHLRMGSFKPLLTTDGPSMQEVEAQIKSTMAPSGVDTDGMHQAYQRTTQELIAHLHRRKEIQEFKERQMESSIPFAATPMQRAAASNSINAFRMSNSSGIGVDVIAGREVSSYHPPTITWSEYMHLKLWHEEQIVNLYALPISLFRNLASTQGNVDMQQIMLHQTLHSWRSQLKSIMTDIYNVINHESDSMYVLSELMERWLRPAMIERLMKTCEEWAEDWVTQTLATDQRGNTGDISSLVTSMFSTRAVLKNFMRTDSTNPGSEFFRKKMAKLSSMQNAGRLSGGSTTSTGPAMGTRKRKRNEASKDILDADGYDINSDNTRERALAIYSLFYEALKITPTENLYEAFQSSDDPKDARWIGKKNSEMAKRSKDHEFEVCYSTPTRITFHELIERAVMGTITPDEMCHMSRVDINLPVTRDFDREKIRRGYAKTIENLQDMLRGEVIKKSMAENVMGPIIGMAEKSIRTDQKKAVGIEKEMQSVSHAHEMNLLKKQYGNDEGKIGTDRAPKKQKIQKKA